MQKLELIGSATVCARLGISRATLVRRIAAGEIVPIANLDGRAWVFYASDYPEGDES